MSEFLSVDYPNNDLNEIIKIYTKPLHRELFKYRRYFNKIKQSHANYFCFNTSSTLREIPTSITTKEAFKLYEYIATIIFAETSGYIKVEWEKLDDFIKDKPLKLIVKDLNRVYNIIKKQDLTNKVEYVIDRVNAITQDLDPNNKDHVKTLLSTITLKVLASYLNDYDNTIRFYDKVRYRMISTNDNYFEKIDEIQTKYYLDKNYWVDPNKFINSYIKKNYDALEAKNLSRFLFALSYSERGGFVKINWPQLQHYFKKAKKEEVKILIKRNYKIAKRRNLPIIQKMKKEEYEFEK